MSVLNYSFDAQIAFIQKARADKKFVIDQPFTPIELIKEIQSQIKCKKNSSVAVMFTIEWAIYLVNEGYTNVTFLYSVEDANIRKACNLYGIKCIIVDEAIKNMKKFDVVVGNPPYQAPKGENGGTRSKQLYKEFLMKTSNFATNWAMVLPSLWTNKKGGSIKKLLNDSGVRVIAECSKYFTVEIRTCYVICDGQQGKRTKIVPESGESFEIQYSPEQAIHLTDSKFTEIFSKLKKYTDLSPLWSRSSINRNDPRIGQPGVDMVESVGTKNNKLDTITVAVDRHEFPGFEHWKVLVNNVGGQRNLGPIKIAGPDLGTSYSVIVLPMASSVEAESMKMYLESKLVAFIISKTKNSAVNSKTIFSFLPKVDFTRSWTDAELYKHFNLTQEEIDYIEKTVK
jgi:hypothetical protein